MTSSHSVFNRPTGRVHGKKPPQNPSGIVLIAVTAFEPLELTAENASPPKRKSSGLFSSGRKDEKKVTFLITLGYNDGRTERIWRTRQEFQNLRDTIEPMVGGTSPGSGSGPSSAAVLPKLTPKPKMGTSIRGKSIAPQNRIPEFQELMWALLWMDDAVVMKILGLFLRVNENDKARAAARNAADAAATGKFGVGGSGSGGLGFGSAAEKKNQLPLMSAVQSLRATDAAELSFSVGDVFEIITDLGPDWLDGRGTHPVTTRGLIPKCFFVDHVPGGQMKATNAADELVLSEQTFYEELTDVAETFFPRLRVILTAPEAKTLFGNWASARKSTPSFLPSFLPDLCVSECALD